MKEINWLWGIFYDLVIYYGVVDVEEVIVLMGLVV